MADIIEFPQKSTEEVLHSKAFFDDEVMPMMAMILTLVPPRELAAANALDIMIWLRDNGIDWRNLSRADKLKIIERYNGCL